MSQLNAICTIFSKNFLAQTRTLTQSFLRHHPRGQVFACLVDQPEGYFNPEQEAFITIAAKDLGIPNGERFSFKYSPIELTTALKPFLLDYLFQTHNLDRIVYVDCDIAFYNPLKYVDSLLDTYGLVLTPHILEPINDDRKPSEFEIGRAGIFNMGFLGISRRGDLKGFLTWWKARLYDHCIYDSEHGFFCDQHWMNFAPALFPDTYILRDPGHNVAYWNLTQRPIAFDGQRYTAADAPIIFIHFSGFTADNIEAVSSHQNRFTLSDLAPAVRVLMQEYRDRLLQNGYETVNKWPFSYGTFANGVPIPAIVRTLYRELDPEGKRWPTPYQPGVNSYFDFLNNPANHVKAKPPYLTNLAVLLYQRDLKLKALVPNGLETGKEQLMQWLAINGQKHYGLDDVFLIPLRPTHAVNSLRRIIALQIGINGLSPGKRLLETARVVFGERRYMALRRFILGLKKSAPLK